MRLGPGIAVVITMSACTFPPLPSITDAATDDGSTAADAAIDALPAHCQGQLEDRMDAFGASIRVFVRSDPGGADDGAVLLGHYATGTLHSSYNPTVAQRFNDLNGDPPPDTWAPEPCTTAVR